MESTSFKTKWIVLLCVLLLAGCGAGPAHYVTLDGYLAANNCRQAVEHMEKSAASYGANEKLLFLLDSALVNMRCHNYEKSNRYYHEAEELAESLWTKSITKELASFVVNDYTIPYKGEDFERAQINLFSAINYARTGVYDEALVECRRLDSLLSMYNDKYEEKNVYKEDALGRYLSGIMYESQGNLEDAYIDYHKAFKTYQDYARHYGTPMPSSLVKDLLRIAQAIGRLDDAAPLVGNMKDWKWPGHKDVRQLGKIVLIHFNGKSPVKQSNTFTVPTLKGPISVAFPSYRVTSPLCKSSQLIVKSADTILRTDTEMVEDINKIAVKNLDDRKGRIIAKTIARTVAKQAVVNQLTSDDSVKWLFNFINTVAIEKADTRSWRTLPGEIRMAIQYVTPGRHEIYSSLCGRDRYLEDIELKAGETKFVIAETM